MVKQPYFQYDPFYTFSHLIIERKKEREKERERDTYNVIVVVVDDDYNEGIKT